MDLGFAILDLGCRVYGLSFRLWDFGCLGSGFCVRTLGSGL